jgi:hypothetical protein
VGLPTGMEGCRSFVSPFPGSRWPRTKQLEYCAVWRYFAQVMGSLLRIAAAFYRGRCRRKEDWDNIHQVPSVLRQTVHRSGSGRPSLCRRGRGDLAVAGSFRWEAERAEPPHLRPPGQYAAGSRGGSAVVYLVGVLAPRSEIRYSSQSLLSQLVLQLCLRVAQVESFSGVRALSDAVLAGAACSQSRPAELLPHVS